MSQPQTPAPRPGRYQRSFGGLVGAMIVMVVVVVGFVVVRGALRDNEITAAESVDYREALSLAQDSEVDPIYPAELPEGWRTTSADWQPGSGSQEKWSLGILTDERRFVGLQQGGADLDEMVELWLGEDAEPRGELDVDLAPSSGLPSRWEEIASERSTGYAAEVAGQPVLVHGSAPAEDVRTLLESLTTDPQG